MSPTNDGSSARAQQIQGILDRCVDRLASGESITHDQVIAAHPDLMPELGEELRKLSLIERAQRRAHERGSSSGVASTLEGDASTWIKDAETIPGYKIVRELHRGGQGVVYEAFQESTRRKVALKVMREGPFAGPADEARFSREVQVLGQLSHPNIVTIHDSGSAAGHHYFVMDYVPGQPLDAYMATAQPSMDETLRLFAKVCEAVNAAHLRGVIHRDLKPGNIRIDTDGEPRILDFGLAKVATSDSDVSAMTLTGQFLGSLPWASPEQAEAVPSKIDVRTDVYSLGVILYQMLTGRFPYDVVGNMRDVIDNILTAEPVKPRTLRRQINDEVETIVLKCLSKERERRYQSAGELARDVNHYLNGEPIEAKRDSLAYVLRKQLKRYRIPAVIGASFVLLITVGLIASLALWQRSERALTAEAAAHREAETRRAAEERERKKAEAVNAFVTKALVSSDPYQGGSQEFLVTDAMEQAVELLDAGELKDQPETEAALRLTISQILNGNARSEEALRLAEQALETYQELYPGDHPTVATSLDTVAICLDFMGRLAEALPKYEAALEMRQRLFEGDHPHIAASLNNVGACLHLLGRFADALPKLEAALEMRQRLLEGDHPELANSLNNVALCLDCLGRAAEALPKFEASLAMSQRLFEGDHPDVAQSLSNVGYCLRSLGRSAEALPRHEAALEMRRRLFQGDHPEVAAGLINVAYCLQSLDRPAEALPKYEAALEMYRRLFEGDHPDVAMGLNDVASCLRSLGRLPEALAKYEAALEMLQRLFEGDHPDVATSLNNVAFCLRSLGRPAEALPKYEAALEMYRHVLPPDHPHTLNTQIRLAQTLVTLGRQADAEPLLLECLGIRQKVLPEGHWLVFDTMSILGEALAGQGKFDEAEPLLLDSYEQLQGNPDTPPEAVRKTLGRIIELYEAWDVAEPGKGYAEKAAEWRAKLPAESEAARDEAAHEPDTP
jgi:tetratricopeptide (TPR) repeat protein